MHHSTAWRLVISAAFLMCAQAARPLLAAEAVAPPTAANAGPTTPDQPYMLDARVVGDVSRVRFVADLSAPVAAAVFGLSDPYRIVIDLPEVHFVLPDGAGETGRGLISAFRYGLISAGKSRVVIDVTGPVAVDKQFVVPPANGQPARLVVDLVPTTRDKFLADAKAYRDTHEVEAEKSVASAGTAGGDADKPLIVLDPGHGGIDSGTRSPDGTLEKNVVLTFANVLGGKLLATGRYRVVYTRTDDSYVTLGDRVQVARSQHAKLFVSIHINSFPGSTVRGAIVYTVADAASDKMAAALADTENQSDALAGIDVKAEDSDQVKDILLDLTQRETRNFGVVFAQALIRHLGKTTQMFKVPHQEASFKVLEAPDVPSALIELGYLTTPADEKQLVSPDWQASTAGSILEAIDGYFGGRTAGAANR
jgi:N-acetylmuramoyl-L-alanine amidase